jgi:hypothetical protein
VLTDALRSRVGLLIIKRVKASGISHPKSHVPEEYILLDIGGNPRSQVRDRRRSVASDHVGSSQVRTEDRPTQAL